jgi:hypothetical protein
MRVVLRKVDEEEEWHQLFTRASIIEGSPLGTDLQ